MNRKWLMSLRANLPKNQFYQFSVNAKNWFYLERKLEAYNKQAIKYGYKNIDVEKSITGTLFKFDT